MAPQNKYSSNIKDYWSQITITNTIMKKTEPLRELPKRDTETQSEQMLVEKRHQQTIWVQHCHKSVFCKNNKTKKQNTVIFKGQ